MNSQEVVTDHWYIACRSKELKLKKPLARTMLGEPIVLFRGTDGEAGALRDRCAHRNLALSRGKVDVHGLRCAYHGWTWNLRGQCTRIPASCDSCESYSNLKVPAYQVAEKQGLVWVAFGQPNAAPMDFPHFTTTGWHHWFMERTFKGNAFHCVENFLDVPHTAHVHRGLFRGGEAKEVEIEITSGKDWIQAEFLNEERMESLIGRLLVPRDGQIVHTDRFQLPYVTRVDYRMSEARQYMVMSQCTPVTENLTRVYTYMAYRFEPLGLAVRAIFEPLSHLILNQDVRIIREQTDDLQRTGPAKFVYWETDAIARGIRDLLDGKDLSDQPSTRKRIRA